MGTTGFDVEAGMPRPTKDTSQITFRIPNAWLEKADALAKRISPPGMEFGRTDAFRACIAKGFEAFDREEERHKLSAVDEDEVFERASKLLEKSLEKEGAIATMASRSSSGFTDKGVYELRNARGLLARFKYDAATDKITKLKD